ncbi:hypothetical protein SLEP1_g5502 [Rubroshorea leprosula]|uniref:Uncharacterized protein n=1 Tax=Rubroshorea leprosula TaxID=152421 RepID=A0AAV5I050_9ROSI|nr:hypothetical protein SLEP1_g5502 [Rubroshorea leprosula]
MTEFNARNSYLNEKKPLECSISAQQGKEPTEKDTGTSIFVNHDGILNHSSQLHRATNIICLCSIVSVD